MARSWERIDSGRLQIGVFPPAEIVQPKGLLKKKKTLWKLIQAVHHKPATSSAVNTSPLIDFSHLLLCLLWVEVRFKTNSDLEKLDFSSKLMSSYVQLSKAWRDSSLKLRKQENVTSQRSWNLWIFSDILAKKQTKNIFTRGWPICFLFFFIHTHYE